MPVPSPNAASLGTPLGDAGFRIQCTYALRERVADRSDWPLRRVAALCRCIADRIREGEARRLLASGSNGLPARLSALEAQLCR